ncbi:MAG TPA: Ig-like domain-containing protein [Phycisphaerae bacterium]|nr:Ig-like domain-containing protein [Phycisphaerae bacterium]
MERTASFRWFALCSAVVALQAATAWGQAQAPTCPVVEDISVNVTSQEAVPFTVGVKNLGSGYVSIYQYPLGGTLVPGKESTDFVFIPDDGFTGTATFMYRVTPESGCQRGALLGKVTFVGPTTGQRFGRSREPSLCGTGTPMVIAVTGLIGARFVRRRPKG